MASPVLAKAIGATPSTYTDKSQGIAQLLEWAREDVVDGKQRQMAFMAGTGDERAAALAHLLATFLQSHESYARAHTLMYVHNDAGAARAVLQAARALLSQRTRVRVDVSDELATARASVQLLDGSDVHTDARVASGDMFVFDDEYACSSRIMAMTMSLHEQRKKVIFLARLRW